MTASPPDCLLCSLGRRHTPYGNQTDYRIFELNKRLQNWTEVGGQGQGYAPRCVFWGWSSLHCLPARAALAFGSGVLPHCAGPQVPCSLPGCGTELINSISEHSAKSAALMG